jgi:alpha-1,6-mannosyltransferase
MAQTVGADDGTAADPQRVVKLNPSRRIYAIAGVLFLALTASSRNFNRMGDSSFVIPMVVAGVAYLLAIREFLLTAKFSRTVIVSGLVLAGIWHILFLRMPPGMDDDIHRYVWDGRLQRLGYNPYLAIPSDPALAALHTPDTRTLNNPGVPSPYPPGAQLFFRAVTTLAESTFAMKMAFVICDLAIIVVLLDILRATGQAAHWVLAYAWHPLLATEVAGSGHIDIVGTLLLVMSFAALLRGWRTVAALTLGLAISVKFLPVVLLPLYWKRVRAGDAALAAAVVGILYMPFLDHWRVPIGSLRIYVRHFRFNDPLFATLERVAAPQPLVALAILVGVVSAVWMRRKSPALPPDAFAWPMAASLLFAPAAYPWYLLWLLPFLRSTSTLPLAVWTVSIIPTFYVWHLRRIGRPWRVPDWIMLLEYGTVVLVALIVALRRRAQQAESPASANQAG